jgi:uncharacterized protein YcfL
MELAKMGKGLLVVLMAAYLVGCSSNGGGFGGDSAGQSGSREVTAGALIDISKH